MAWTSKIVNYKYYIILHIYVYVKLRDHAADLLVYEMIILKLISRNSDVKLWIGFNWLRI